MPEITIKIEVPEGCTVRVEGVSGLATARSESRPTGSTSGGSSSPRAPSGARGEGDGSASEKQKKLIFARAKAAGMELSDLLATVGLTSLDDLGWRDVNALIEVLDTGSRPPDTHEPPPVGDPEIPF